MVGFLTVINFSANRSQELVQVRILFDDVRETNENFTVNLYALKRTGAVVQDGVAVVTIEEQAGENVRFPGAPLVTVRTDELNFLMNFSVNQKIRKTLMTGNIQFCDFVCR